MEAERIGVVCDGAEVDVRVVAGRLAGRGTVEVPFWQIFQAGDLLGDGLEISMSVKLFFNTMLPKSKRADSGMIGISERYMQMCDCVDSCRSVSRCVRPPS